MRFSLLLLFTVFLNVTPAWAQCTGPVGALGDMIFNQTHDSFQGCTTRGWMVFHEPDMPVDPCTVSNVVGTACTDGQTVYAGTWNSNRYYTTVADQTAGLTAYYGTYNATLGVNAQSADDGFLNTNTALTTIEANPSSGFCGDQFNPPDCMPNAHALCKGLRTTLGGDWYLPAMNELINVLYTNRVAINGFSTASSDYYWSSTETNNLSAKRVQFSNGASSDDFKDRRFRVRCLRR